MKQQTYILPGLITGTAIGTVIFSITNSAALLAAFIGAGVLIGGFFKKHIVPVRKISDQQCD